MGVVYEAYDPSLDRTVALKTVKVAFATTPDDTQAFEKRFFAEAQIAARLSHPGIVIIHDVGRDAETGTLFIALEHLTGTTLAERVTGGQALDWREALRIAAAVAEALNYAHSRKVVHLDIKPANIMLLPNGQPKLMDFGIARIETARLKVTASGQFFGTPLFMCPEQALGRTLDGRADLFSLGAVLYTLLTGRLAFQAESITRILMRVIGEQPDPPSRIVAGLPEEVDYLIERALAKSPADRYLSGRMLAEDAQDLLAGRRPRHRRGWSATPLPEAPPPPAPSLASIEDSELEPLLEAIGPDTGADLPPADASMAVEAPAAPRSPSGGGPREPTWVAAVAMPRTAVRDERERQRRIAWWRRVLRRSAGAAAVVLMAILLLRAKQPTPSAPDPGPSPTDAAASGSASPDRSTGAWRTAPNRDGAPTSRPTPAAMGEPARLLVDFEHPLKSGQLRVWVDEQLMLDESLAGRVTKKLIIKVRQGSFQEQLDLVPGRHDIRVQVAWDDNERTERIWGTFKEGDTRRLEIRLGRVRKNLSVDWK